MIVILHVTLAFYVIVLEKLIFHMYTMCSICNQDPSRPMSSWHWAFDKFDLTSCLLRHAQPITPIAHQGVGFVLSLHQCASSHPPTKLETFLITLHIYSLLSGLDPISFTVSMLWIMMPLGMFVELVGLLSTTMMYCSLGTSHSMACDEGLDVGGREEGA